MGRNIFLGKDAGKQLVKGDSVKGDYEFRVTICDNIIGTKMTPREYEIIAAVVKRSVEKGEK
ncbi:MAG TPA: hypothetical protein ENI23_14930 [bacterium]|nr:hypothetical protein [bacterium]